MENKKKKILNIIEWVIVLAVTIFAISWVNEFSIKTDDEGNTTCYNIWKHEIRCKD